MENLFVNNIYEKIAYHFNHTRTYYWFSIKEFVLSFNNKSLLLDAGCGNGKNMLIRNDCMILGLDNCNKLIEISKNKKLNVLLSNIKNIPFRNNLFDGVFCVAVIHHLENKENRLIAINELIRVTKSNGKIFIQVWDKDIKKNNKFIKINNDNDYFVTWKLNNKEIVLKRYYHLFSKIELLNLIDYNLVELIEIKNEFNNWIIILKKK